MPDSPDAVSRAVRLALAVALLVAGAGCLGTDPGGPATATPSPTTFVGTDCPP